MRGWLVGVLPVLAAALAFHPITRGYFYSDDFVALYALANGTGERWLVTPTGGHLLLLRNLAYAVTWALAGVDARAYLWSAFATHLAVTALLFALVRRATGHALLAAVTAALWGTCRTNAGTLEWYAVYGQALATLLLAVVLVAMMRDEAHGTRVGAGRALAWGALLLAASTCFGTGVAVALLYPVLLVVTFGRGRLTGGALGVALAVPPVMAALYVTVHLASGPGLDATGPFTELARLAEDIPLYARFFANLLTTGAASLVLGAAWERTAYPDAASLVAAALVAGTLVAGAAAGTPRRRRLLVAMLLVAAGAYAVVAAGRATLYDLMGTRYGQDPVAFGATTARYHYLAQFALAAALGIGLGGLLERRSPARPFRIALGSMALAAIVAATWLRPPVVDTHANVRTGVQRLLTTIHIEASRANGPVALLENRPWGAGGPLLGIRPERFPGIAGAFVVFFRDDVVDGRQIRFVAPEAEVRASRAAGGRIATLLVPASDVPNAGP
jgi:hypothetical protein